MTSGSESAQGIGDVLAAVHVTSYYSWDKIRKEGMMRRSGRKHIHLFAPKSTTVVHDFDFTKHGVTEEVEVIIFIDLEKAKRDKVLFYPHRKNPGVVLTRGINGTLPPEYFSKAEDFKTREVIWTQDQAEEPEPKTPASTAAQAAALESRNIRESDEKEVGLLVHGTDIRALQYIEEEGIQTGLRKNGERRHHIHCAKAPENSEDMPFLPRRPDSEVFVYIDGKKMQNDGIKFWSHLHDKNTVLTPGNDGVIPPEYFVKIVPKTYFTLPPLLRATLTDFKDIPVVDLSKDDAAIAPDISRICQDIGFFQIVNHGVPLSMMDKILEAAKQFFSLPEAEKQKCDSNGGRGHFRMGAENLNLEDKRFSLGDLKEGYDVGRDDGGKQHPAFGYNKWPSKESAPGFRRTVNDYYQLLETLGARMMRLFALALRLQPTHFDKMVTKPVATLRMLHYPPVNVNDGQHKQLGAGAHKDYGCCTILLQDDAGGLQAQNAKGEWIYVRPITGAFVINMGEMTERWTNNRFGATVHRVFNHSNKDRYSVPFFFNPNLETRIAPLPEVLDDENQSKVEGETCEAILAQRYGETFQQFGKKEETEKVEECEPPTKKAKV